MFESKKTRKLLIEQSKGKVKNEGLLSRYEVEHMIS